MPPKSQEREFRDAWRAVANAKLNEYRRQCWRLAGLVRAGTVVKQAAINDLMTIATAHALARSLGEDRIEAILVEAFAGTEFREALINAKMRSFAVQADVFLVKSR
jgi:hypothetical protein